MPASCSAERRVIVGPKEALETHRVYLRDVNWLGDETLQAQHQARVLPAMPRCAPPARRRRPFCMPIDRHLCRSGCRRSRCRARTGLRALLGAGRRRPCLWRRFHRALRARTGSRSLAEGAFEPARCRCKIRERLCGGRPFSHHTLDTSRTHLISRSSHGPSASRTAPLTSGGVAQLVRAEIIILMSGVQIPPPLPFNACPARRHR